MPCPILQLSEIGLSRRAHPRQSRAKAHALISDGDAAANLPAPPQVVSGAPCAWTQRQRHGVSARNDISGVTENFLFSVTTAISHPADQRDT
jgi:hypothetical protein